MFEAKSQPHWLWTSIASCLLPCMSLCACQYVLAGCSKCSQLIHILSFPCSIVPMLPSFPSPPYIDSVCPAGFSCLGCWWSSMWLQQSSMTAPSGNKLVEPFQGSTFHGLHGHGALVLPRPCCGCWSASSCWVSKTTKLFFRIQRIHVVVVAVYPWMEHSNTYQAYSTIEFVMTHGVSRTTALTILIITPILWLYK